MKRIKMMLVAMVMTGVAFMPLKAEAATVKIESVSYETEDDGTAYVSSIDGTAQNITVSDTVVYGSTTYTVTSVGVEAFALTDITAVKLPDSVKTIGDKAFYGCKNLKKVNIPSELISVGSYAFGGTCAYMPTFPDSVTVADNAAETLPETPETEESEATDAPLEDNGNNIASNSGVNGSETSKEPTVESTQQTTQNTQQQSVQQQQNTQQQSTQQQSVQQAVAAATQQETVVVTVTKEEVQNKKFTLNGVTYQLNADMTATLTSCKKSKKVTIPSVIKLDGKNYKVTKIASKAFYDNNRLKTITFGKNVKEIGAKAFYKCTSLKKVTLPKSVTKVGSKAFYGCKKLKKVSMKAKSASIGTGAFKKCSKKIKISATFLK